MGIVPAQGKQHMKTKALTIFLEDNLEVCRFARYLDGEPEKHGVDLAGLCDKAVVSSIPQSGGNDGAAPSMGALAAFAASNITLDAGYHHVEMMPYRSPSSSLPPGFDVLYVVREGAEPGDKPFITVSLIGGGDKLRLDQALDRKIFSGEPASLIGAFGLTADIGEEVHDSDLE